MALNLSMKLGLWELALQAKGRESRPAGFQRHFKRQHQQGLWDPAGWLKPPFRGHGPLPQSSRDGFTAGPGHRDRTSRRCQLRSKALKKGWASAITRGIGIYPVSESVFCPSGTLENRTFDRERTGTYSQRSRKGRTQTRDPGWRARASREGSLESCRVAGATLSRAGPARTRCL